MLALLLSSISQITQPAPPPSILVIVVDDVGWSERPYLPALDALAGQGMTFNRAYSWPVCSPTRYAALYGRYPRRADIGDVINAHDTQAGASLPPDRLDVSLAEALKPTHKTALFGKWHLGRAALETPDGDVEDLLAVTESGPFVAGFDVWRAGNPNSIAQPQQSASGYRDWYRVDDNEVDVNHGTYATDAQRVAWSVWWNETPDVRFAWLAFNAAHQPYDAPPPGFPQLEGRAAYLAVVEYLDGALEAVLNDVNLTETYVVFFSDNGTPHDVPPPGGPADHWKGTTYEGGVRVPLLIAGPGIHPGITSNRLVSIADLPATLMEVLGVEARGFGDSVSFADALGNWTGAPARTWVFTERYDVPAPNGYPTPGYDDQAVIEANWKLRVWDPDGGGLQFGESKALYHLPTDPDELNPLPLTFAPTVSARLQAELASVGPRP